MTDDTARMLDDTAERILSRRLAAPSARSEATLRGALLDDAMAAGLPLVLVAEEDSGLAGSLADAAVIAGRWGWHAAPLPIVEMLLLPTLPSVTPEDWMGGRLALCSTRGLRLEAGRLSGPPIEAPVIGESMAIAVLCLGDDGPVIVEIDAAGAEPFRVLSHEPWLRVDPRSAVVRAVRPCPVDKDKLAIRGALLTAAGMVGAMGRILDITIEHANTRTQFGRPLCKFQAVQHRIAEAASEHAVAQAVLDAALAEGDSGAARPLLWQSAKVQAGRAATIVAAAAHQVLGAIGFTEEHVLHHFTKRLWTWRDDWGRQSALEEAIGRSACSDGNGLWSYVVDDTAA